MEAETLTNLTKNWEFDFMNGHLIHIGSSINCSCLENISLAIEIQCPFLKRVTNKLWKNSSVPLSIKDEKLPGIICALCKKRTDLKIDILHSFKICHHCYTPFHSDCINQKILNQCTVCYKTWTSKKNRMYWNKEKSEWLIKKVHFEEPIAQNKLIDEPYYVRLSNLQLF